jgi:hypothetical protein
MMDDNELNDPDFGRARLGEPVDRYIKQFGNPVTESEAVAMIRAVDPTLDEWEARERADEEFDFTRAVIGNDWDGHDDSEDRWTTIVPLSKLLAIPARGQDASERDMTVVFIFWQQLLPVILDWDFPEGGTRPPEEGEAGGTKVTEFGIAALGVRQMQSTWMTALAQWLSAAGGRRQQERP